MTVRTWAQCMRVERSDGQVLAMTELDADITYDGVTYSASLSYTPTTIDGTANLSVNNAETGGNLLIAGVNKDDLVAGLYDGATVYFLLIDYSNNTLVRHLGKGYLGESEIKELSYSIEYRSLTQKLQQTVGRFYTAECNAQLGDARCGVNLATFTKTGTVTSVTSNQVFAASALPDVDTSDDWFNYGLITFTSGLNNGIEREVKDYVDATGTLTTFQPFPYDIATSDTFSVYAGCDYRKTTCIGTFNNVINFRGFDMIPGRDQITKFGGR